MAISGKHAFVIWLCALVLLLWLGAPGAMAAGWQAWPEMNWFLPVNPDTQLLLVVALVDDLDTEHGELEVGATLRLDLDTFQRWEAETPEERERQYLLLGLGYRHIRSLGDEEDLNGEHRGIIELTPRFYLPHNIIVSDRNRVDLRWIDGEDFSTRYRNRLTVEREFRSRRRVFSLYAEVEVFNDSRYEGWDRVTYDVGIQLPFEGAPLLRSDTVQRAGTVLEFYYLYQDDKRNPDNTLNAIGAIYKIYY